MTTFPSTPSIGDLYDYGGFRYKWDGSKWSVQSTASVQKSITSLSGENIDLSKGTYHKLATNTGQTITFNNIPNGSSKWSLELTTDQISKYDIAGAAGKAQTASVALNDTTPFQVSFKPDGTKFFFVGYGSDKVYEYEMTTPWDISTATLTTATFTTYSFTTLQYDDVMMGLTFHPDGTYMYLSGFNTKTAYQFELTTPWDITTAVDTGKRITFTTANGFGYNILFNDTGTLLYISWVDLYNAFYIRQYSLSTPWDISTASLTTDKNPTTNYNGSRLAWSNDGKKLYFGSGTNVNQYSVSTPWDITSTVTFDVSYAILNETGATSINFNNDGSKMYIGGASSDTLRQYDTSFRYNPYSGSFTFPSEVIWNGNIAPTISAEQTNVIDFMSPDSGTTIYAKPRLSKNLDIVPGSIYSLPAPSMPATATWYYITHDLSQFIGKSIRFVVLFKNYAAVDTYTKVDYVTLNGTLYNFENTTGNWQTGAVSTTDKTYNAVSWITPVISSSSATYDQWTVNGSGGANSSIWSMYGRSNSATGYVWLRSPLVTLSNATLTYYASRQATTTDFLPYIVVE